MVMEHRLEFVEEVRRHRHDQLEGAHDDAVIGRVKDLTEGFGVDVVMELAGFPLFSRWG